MYNKLSFWNLRMMKEGIYMSRSGIVNVRMVITEEKILSNIEKVHKMINPKSKKQIIQLDDDTYFKDLVEAIKTYLFLKIKCQNQPLSNLFVNGTFNNLNLDEIEISNNLREYLKSHPAAAALYEYASLKNDKGVQLSEKIIKQIKKAPESI